jgi:exonuclease SbcC
MIQRLELQNFQSHEHSILEFDPGVNVIVGQTDSGKTAIFRALELVIRNKPGGDAYRSYWGGDTNVILTVDGVDVVRHKSKGDNMYAVGDDEYRAFGASVPDAVAEILNFGEVNIQKQMDPPYLISSSAGEVAAHFNRVAHLDQIDIGLKNVQAGLRKLNSKKEETDEMLEQQEQELKQYAYLDKFEAKLEVLESLQERKERLIQQHARTNKLIKLIETTSQSILTLESFLRLEESVNTVVQALAQLKALKDQRETLQNRIDRIRAINEKIKELKGLTALEDTVNAVFNRVGQRNTVRINMKALDMSIRLIEQTEHKETQMNEKVIHLTHKYNELMPDICPLCGNETNKTS